MAANMNPTYGELFSFLEAAELEASQTEVSTARILVRNFHLEYPTVPISRPGRFLDTVKRLAAATRPSAVRPAMAGTPLRSYLQRRWIPRIRNMQGKSCINNAIIIVGHINLSMLSVVYNLLHIYATTQWQLNTRHI